MEDRQRGDGGWTGGTDEAGGDEVNLWEQEEREAVVVGE